MADPIYDPDKKKAVTRPSLQALEGGGKTSPPAGDSSTAPEPADLAKKEETPPDPHQVGRGYRPDNPEELTKLKPSVKGVFGFAKTNRGKVIIGGAAAGFITLLIIGFFALLPFKILHIVNNLQNRFFATSENAVQKETDALFSSYIKKYVLPGLNTCKGSTIDKSCTPKEAIQGNSMVSKLYQGWRTARFENTIAEKYGLEFKKANGGFYMKMPGMTGDGASLGDENTGFIKSGKTLEDFIDKSSDNDGQFRKVGRSELRQAYRGALQNETKWKSVMYRYKVGGLLAKKYGLKRCIIACGTRDNFNDWKDNKFRAAKMILAERVLGPRSETLAIVIQCVISGGCDPNNRSETDSDGRKQNKTQAQLQEKLAILAAQNTGKYADVLANSSTILKDGYKKFILQKIVKKLGGEGSKVVSEKIAGNLVPVVGWVNTASGVVNSLENADKGIKAWSYMANATAMVSLYTTYRVFADETKSGNVDPTILGSFTSQLSSVADKTATGGTASAEQAPLYATLIGGANPQQSGSSSYKCNDGNPVPAGRQVCQEEVLGGSNSAVADTINSVLRNLGPLKGLLDFWHDTAGQIIEPLINAFSYIADVSWVPGYDALLGHISSAAEPIISSFTDWIIPSPFSDNMSGGRTFDMMAGGADVSGNDYAQNGLGGKALSPQQALTILNEQTQQDVQNYKSQSFFARMFDTNSNYSPATKLATAMPSSWSSAGQTIASLFSNPFGKLGHGFASLFSPSHVFAAATAQADPFGITQYGYPSDDPRLADANADPEKYWDENCSADGTTLDWSKGTNAAWQDNETTTDANTGMPKNDTTNPCLLIQAAVGSAGGLYDSSLLTTDDLAGNPSASGSTPDTSTIAGPAPSTLNGQPLDSTEQKWILYIAQNVVPLLPNDVPDGRAGMAARVTWWSLREGVLKITKGGFAIENTIGFSNCGDTGGNNYKTFVQDCPVTNGNWQLGIGAISLNLHSLTEIEAKAKDLHPDMSLDQILGQVATLAEYSQGTLEYDAAINSSGPLRASLLMRDPATGFFFEYTDVINECLGRPKLPIEESFTPQSFCLGNSFSKNKAGIEQIINELTAYFQGSSGPASTPSGNAQELAKQILASPNIDLSTSNYCRYCMEDITNTSNGQPAYGNVNLNINLLKFLLALSQATRVDVNSITGAGSGHSENSNHYSGIALDLGCSVDHAKADQIASQYGMKRYSGEACPQDGHWHYSTTGD